MRDDRASIEQRLREHHVHMARMRRIRNCLWAIAAVLAMSAYLSWIAQ